MDAAAREVAASPLWRHLSQQLGALPPRCALPAIRHMVVYGLGSLEQPGAVHIRYQLALATLLAAALPPAAAPPVAFDPVFTQLDRAVLAHFRIEVGACQWLSTLRPVSHVYPLLLTCSALGPATALPTQVLPHDEGGRRVAEQPTLFWMPHCEAVLTDALLTANAAAGTLHNVVILGNRFSGYRDSWALRQRAQQAASGSGSDDKDSSAVSERPETMLRLCECGAVQELRIDECGFPVASAFNDLGLHSFL